MWNGLIHVSIKFMATKPIALELVRCSIARLHDTNMFTDVSFLYHLCATYGEPIVGYSRHVCVSGIVLNFFHFTIAPKKTQSQTFTPQNSLNTSYFPNTSCKQTPFSNIDPPIKIITYKKHCSQPTGSQASNTKEWAQAPEEQSLVARPLRWVGGLCEDQEMNSRHPTVV